MNWINRNIQLVFTCSELTVETLEQGLVSLLLTLNIFHTLFSCVSILSFEHVIAGWGIMKM